MKRYICLLAILTAIAALLCGCSLARSDMDASAASRDRLIGVSGKPCRNHNCITTVEPYLAASYKPDVNAPDGDRLLCEYCDFSHRIEK